MHDTVAPHKSLEKEERETCDFNEKLESSWAQGNKEKFELFYRNNTLEGE